MSWTSAICDQRVSGAVVAAPDAIVTGMRVGPLLAAAVLAAGCSQPVPAPPAKAAEPRVFANVVLMKEPGWPTPDSFDEGRLETRGPCLILRTADGLKYSPVLPFGSRVVDGGGGKVSVVIVGTTLAEGEDATFKGGTGQYGRSTPGPAVCPPRQFVVGHVMTPEELKALSQQMERTPLPSPPPAR